MTEGQRETDPERKRLREEAAREANWKRWGAYLSERQWGTVREDYSADGDTWRAFPHEHARSRAYRWGEDGLLGFCDRQCRLCFSVALWNGADPFLKERLFGLTNHEGNHGEDVKELYYYLDATPTYSYAKALYKYPQAEFPYARLLEENSRRTRADPEFELPETGVFEGNRYFDVIAEYAKASPEDILIRITVANRGPEAAWLAVLPTLWFRNTWIWGCRHEGCTLKPRLDAVSGKWVTATHETLGGHVWHADKISEGENPELLFTENETNTELLFGDKAYTPYVKDAFHRYVVEGDETAVSPDAVGTKAAALYRLEIEPGEEKVIRLRLRAKNDPAVAEKEPFGEAFDGVFAKRLREANHFYSRTMPSQAEPEERDIMRQAYAGLLWSKQFYHYVVEDWLDGDPDQPAPPPGRDKIRNSDWRHLFNRDLISMPDKWEYPWFAAWDLAFHMIPLAEIDPDFAKKQLLLFLREWYMHPNGQLPAYEYNFSDVNPPVHAWGVWRVYKIEAGKDQRDLDFLARAFQKLVMNFTWWVNRKDSEGKNLFGGGFLGLDNIGVFDRSQPLPTGGKLEQSDATAWMAFYCTTMLSMALELARERPAYEDMASKFFEHFVAIADSLNHFAGSGLWNEEDGFYYDALRCGDELVHLKVRSLVGLLPMIAVEVLEERDFHELPDFTKRTQWFLKHRSDLALFVSYLEEDAEETHRHRLLAMCSRERLERLLRYLLDENEFLAPYGIRSLSRYHEEHPYEFTVEGERHRVSYEAGESSTWMFGGNSNWRGPVWLPMNYLIIEALERYHFFYGNDFQVEFPTGSGVKMNLKEVARELGARLMKLFLVDGNGARPCHGGDALHGEGAGCQSQVLFYEYFNPETGKGLGASHQTGWTALVNRLIRKKYVR